jgi:hypothetical protein
MSTPAAAFALPVASTEAVTGSNPVAPTTPALTSRILRAAPVRREQLKHAPSPPTLIAVRQADTFLRDRRTSLEAATTADLEAFMADLPARQMASTAATYHKVLKILYGWLAEEEEIPVNPMAK